VHGYEVLAIRYGTRRLPRSVCFADHALTGEPDGDEQMDYFLWVVRGDEGVVVVDTGFSAAAGRARDRRQLAEPLAVLRELGIEPEKVDTLVLTHMHWDHTGHLEAFPAASIYVQERELAFWDDPISHNRLFSHLTEPDDLARVASARAEGRVRSVDGDTSIGPGIRLSLVGGHTPGQQIVEIDGQERRIVLASDAAHFYEDIDSDRTFSATVDFVAAFRALVTLRALRADGAVIVPGHDPLVCSRHRPLLRDVVFAI
jgi:glyoxylase-like metal-dependent hydrolase (beta-lactamase superfamily II)